MIGPEVGEDCWRRSGRGYVGPGSVAQSTGAKSRATRAAAWNQ
jgi:hypothetical protein